MKLFNKKIFFIFSFILISGSLFILPIFTKAHAEQPEKLIEISPLIFNISLDPGKTYNYKLKVKNLTKSPLPVKAYFENFTSTGEDGGYIFDNKPNPLISWSTVSPKDLIIPANESRELDLKITIPNQVSLGGYYGVLFIEPLINQKTNQNTLVSAKIGALLLANVGVNDIAKAKIIEFQTNLISEDDEVNILLRVRNEGLNHFSAKPKIIFEPIIGNKKTVNLEEKFVFPGKVRRWEQSIKIPNKWHGIYRVKVSVSTGNGQQVYDEKLFISFPISKAILIILIASLIMFLTIKRDRVKKAIRAFTENKS
jgi:hypothetical protein